MDSKRIYLAVLLASLVLFYPFLGLVHLFDWDEINFAEAAREMIVTGNYSMVQIDYHPFWEKPPLFFWLQAISMKIFGINEFAARFPNALCGTLSLLTFVWIGKRNHNLRFGLIWAGLYTASLLPQLYFRSGIIDPWFNYFIFSGIYLAYEYVISLNRGQEKLIYVAAAGAAIGLGVLTKGPVALLIFGLTAGLFAIFRRFNQVFTLKAVGVFLLTFLLFGGSWFIIEIASGRSHVVVDFINYQIRLLQTQDAGHGGPFLYHWYVLLVGCFPLSILALNKLLKPNNPNKEKRWLQLIMIILFWSVLLLFSLVKTKIIHYSSMCYFPLSYLAALELDKIIDNKTKVWQSGLTLFIGSVLLLLFIGVPLVGMNVDWLLNSGVMNDPFAEANLQAELSWGAVHFIPAAIMLLAIVLFVALHGSKKWISFLVGTSLAFTSMNVFLVPNIEGISQRAAIDFFESKAEEDCLIDTWGYFSYANLFYTNKRPQSDPKHRLTEHLLKGLVDKPVYIVTKNIHKDEFLVQNPNFKLLYEKNGFAFFQRHSGG